MLSAMGDRPRKVLLTGPVILFLLLTSNTLLLAYYIYQPEISSFLPKPSPNQNLSIVSQSLAATVASTPEPTPLCKGLTLQVGSHSFHIASLGRASDGSVSIPDNTADIAYWIRDSGTVYVFALSRMQNNLDLFASLQGGEEAVLTSEDCDTLEYILSAPQSGEPGQESLAGQLASGITVYIPSSSASLKYY